MQIKKIKLQDFRNYGQTEVEFHEYVNLISGENAQGKTNLLESIYVASLGRSFRTPKEKEMIRFGKEGFYIRGTFTREGREETVEIRLPRDGKKEIQVDKVRTEKLSDMMERFYVVVFSPEDLKIIKEEPEKRRSFIDRELCRLSIAYLHNLVLYKKTLQQRNAYLKEERRDGEAMKVWDESLSRYGAAVIHRRKKFIEEIHGISREIHGSITQGKENLDIRYQPSIPPQETIEETQALMAAKLAGSLVSDIRQGSTTLGPHKDDLNIEIDGIQARAYGSQGQQRTAALSMKLAEIRLIEMEKGEKPILLLDDVLSELDAERQKYLVKALSGSQLFITAADLSEELEKELPEGFSYLVKAGKINRK